MTLELFSLGVDPVNKRLVPVLANALRVYDDLIAIGQQARAAARKLAKLSTAVKNQALLNIAGALEHQQRTILAANREDCRAGQQAGLSEALLDRLLLDPERLAAMAGDVRNVASLPDPVGESFDVRTLPNGLQLGRRRVPLGVIGAIYESRPNVTVDITALCLKSGNAVILRGGSEAIRTNTALVRLLQEAIGRAGVPEGAVRFIESTDHAVVDQMLKMKEYIDLLIPRGGPELIRRVAAEATMPVVTGGMGVCHTYVDRAADLEKAVAIAYNAKVQRPTVCNALDTLLVHVEIAPRFLPQIAHRWSEAGVEMHADDRAMSILGPLEEEKVVPATQQDWGKEFLSLTAAVKVVDSLDDALEHIERYGSGHSEAIVTEDYSAAMRFLDEVDAAVVLVNASTRFTDGAQFGLGAEVAISTSKMHARGPMGLRELTSYKWTGLGSGQVRP
ncbi:MAG: glutamate-5-semialdehyde dehydrogenase [Chloroflexi bacterium]|nr:glutamate-5-semialdehyde dehydrogenase [Chloroflexota bacterium]